MQIFLVYFLVCNLFNTILILSYKKANSNLKNIAYTVTLFYCTFYCQLDIRAIDLLPVLNLKQNQKNITLLQN